MVLEIVLNALNPDCSTFSRNKLIFWGKKNKIQILNTPTTSQIIEFQHDSI